VSRVAALTLFLVACKPTPVTPVKAPQTRATVLTIQTHIEPEKRTFAHLLVISGDLARSGDELDTWRLFDLKQKRVTYVDDIARTYRSEPFAAIVNRRRAADAQPPAVGSPHVEIRETGATRVIQGVESKQIVIRAGRYQRELWVGSHPQIAPDLFAMMHASAPARSPLSGVTRHVDEKLFVLQGFPMSERAELPYGRETLRIERNVVKIEQRNIPTSWLRVGPGYRDLDAKAPDVRHPPDASRLLDRNVLREGLRSFGKDQKSP
jgi:hypothetical protein